jgi:ATP-dependent DNA helicase RecQ
MTLIEEHDKPAQLIFNCSRDSLYKVNVGGNEMDKMLRTILRLYDGIFSRFRTIDELMIATHAELSPERVHELLKVLWRMNVIRYIPAARSPIILFQTERLPSKDIYISPDSYGHRQRLMHERFENMLRYATSEDECRSQIIERYFGDTSAKECGVCDNCIRRKQLRNSENTDEDRLCSEILALLGAEPCSVKDIVARIKGEPRRIVEIVDKMLREGKISLDKGDKLRIIS